MPLITARLILICYASLVAWPATAGSLTKAWQQAQSHGQLSQVRALADAASAQQQAAHSAHGLNLSLVATGTYLDDDLVVQGADLAAATHTGSALIDQLLGELAASATTKLGDRANIRGALVARYPVYWGGAKQATEAVASINTQIANSAVLQVEQALFIELVNRYFGVAQDQLLTRLSREQAMALELHQRNANALERQGQIAAAERILADAALSDAQVHQRNAAIRLTHAQFALSQLTQVSPNDDNALLLVKQVPLPPLTVSLGMLLTHSPLIETANHEIEKTQQLVKLAKAAKLPKVALIADVNLYKDDELASELTPN